MKMYQKLAALTLIGSLILPSTLAFADSNETMDSNIISNQSIPLEEPFVMEQRPLSDRDIKAMDYAKKIIKEYFSKDVGMDDYIVDIIYTSDYADEEILNLPGFRNMVTVNFISKSIDSSDGAYLTYYEDNKEVVSGSVSYWDYNLEKTLTYEEGKKIAEEFISRFANVDMDSLMYKEFNREYYNQVNFAEYYYQRIENGLEYDANQIFVGVSLVDGKILSYYRAWNDEIEFPSNAPVISQEDAEKILMGSIIPELIYMRTPDDEGRGRVVYVMNLFKGDSVDGKTKEIFNQSGQINIIKFNPDMKRVNEILKNAQKIDIPRAITLDEGIEIARKIIMENFGVELKGRVPEEMENEKQIYVEFIDGEIEAGGTVYYVGIDLENGELTYMARMDTSIIYHDLENINAPQIKSSLTYEEAYYRALEYLAKYYPKEIKKVELSQTIYTYGESLDNQLEFSFIFPRVNQGIPFYEQVLDIRISRVDGKIQGISRYFEENIIFEDPSDLIEKDKAKEIFFSGKELKLMYAQDYTATEKISRPVVRLVYRLIDKGEGASNYIDAKTGEYIIFPIVPIDIMPEEM